MRYEPAAVSSHVAARFDAAPRLRIHLPRVDVPLVVALLGFLGLIAVALLGGRLAPHESIYFVVEHGTEVARFDHRPRLSPAQEAAIQQSLTALDVQPFAPPPLAELIQRHGLTPELLQYLVAEGQVIRLTDDIVLSKRAFEEAAARLRTYLRENRTLTVAAARDLLGSSRRYVLPLLEWLDAQKITRRVGDDRILRG